MTYPGDIAAAPQPVPPSQGQRAPIPQRPMPGRMAVPGIGQRRRPEEEPKTMMEEMATLIYQDAAGRSLLDPNSLKDMPAWAVGLMNQNRLMSVELATFYTLLVDRGLITPHEIATYRRAIMAEHDKCFQKMVEQLGRQVLQQPNTAPPSTDPRQSPG